MIEQTVQDIIYDPSCSKELCISRVTLLLQRRFPVIRDSHLLSTNYTISIKQTPNVNTDTLFCNKKKGLQIASLNIQHLLPKIDEIKFQLLQDKMPKILALCETFLTEKTNNNLIEINNFAFERKDRIGSRKGGGLIVYISDTISYRRRLDIELNEVESIWIQVSVKGSKPFLVNFIYRPPNSSQNWIDLYESELNLADSICSEIHILGDVNIKYFPNAGPDIFDNSRWQNCIENFDLKQLICSPTRVGKTSSNIIDHIYSNKSNQLTNIRVPFYSISDHYPVCCTRMC